MTETTTTEPTREELEQRLEAVMLANLREELELIALHDFDFGSEFRGLKEFRDELIVDEVATRITTGEATIGELARQLGVDRVTVYRWLRQAGAEPTPRRRVSIEQRAADLRARLMEGQSVSLIAADLGVNRSTVHRWLRHLRKGGDFPETPRGRTSYTGPRPQTLLQQDEAMRRRADGETVKSIAANMGVTVNTVFRWMRAAKKEAADV
ncbi:helix-turn-helix domain-containing protein [Pseudoclavibacter terrae]|uniref:helix-turn-helix domain-containing protein n=1 Tax=Pseudoclavibacter terrae TaxID=1530195 RepID=UPI00232E514D|nr:helix-turn-helix domain-containing protein [Pseudoclavibacter terrae]